MDKLPAELRMAICRGLSLTDVTSLALCCHSHAAFVRPLLYEHIVVTDQQIPRSLYLPIPPSWQETQSRILSLVATVMSQPSLFGPLVKSLHIDQHSRSTPGVCWMDLAPFFRATTNLYRLRVESQHRFNASHFSKIFSSLPPSASLTGFDTSYTPAVQEVFAFLGSRPKLSSLRLGVVSRSGSHEDEPQSVLSMAPLPLLKVLAMNVGHRGLAFTTTLLQASGRLDHLSIKYSYRVNENESHPSVIAHLESLSTCYATLNRLSIENAPHRCDQPFSWVLSNILPRTPNLHVLELRQPPNEQSPSSRKPQHILRTASSTPEKSDVMSTFPTKLETLRWVGEDARFTSVASGLSALGTSNVQALFEIFSSLKVVEYHERGYMFIHRRLEGGVIRRQTMRSDEFSTS